MTVLYSAITDYPGTFEVLSMIQAAMHTCTLCNQLNYFKKPFQTVSSAKPSFKCENKMSFLVNIKIKSNAFHLGNPEICVASTSHIT